MKLNVKQILSLGISVVFLGATVFLIYGFFTGKTAEVSPNLPTDLTKAGGERANLLPYGSTLEFDSIQRYNDGSVQPFQYPVVNSGEVGVSTGDLVKATSSQ